MAEEEPARPGAEEAMELSEEEGAAAAAAAADDDDDDYHDEDDDDDDATVSESELEGEEGGRTKKKGKDKDDAAAGNGKAKAGKKEGQEARKRARQELNDSIARRKEEIINEKKKKLHVRLRYLLAQSDIFSTHFGLGKAVEDAGVEPPKSADEDEGDLPTTFLLKQPASLQGQLRGYQLEGLNWMINLQEQGINGILADEMGLGKTIQTISVMTYLLDFKNITGPHLVLLPKSTLSNWIQEFKRFSPKLRTLRFHGDKEERQALIREVLMPGVSPEDRSWDVCVTTYEIARMEQTALAQVAWRYLVVDEAHRLKNEASMFSVAVRGFTAQHRLLLTGTPLQNNLRELWALLNFLLPDVFGDADKFGAFFDLDIDDNEKKTSLISQLHKILRPFMLRRLKSDAAKELPPKTETILFTNLSQVQRDVYKGLLMRNLDAVNGGSGTARSSLLNIVMQLRKCCNHPYLFAGVEDRSLDPLGEHVVQSCGKLRLLDKLLARLARDGHRVLLFSQMTRMLDILEDFMRMRGHPYCRIDGDTSYDEREDLIENFNAPGSDKFCFLLSTRAGGLGINLQSADTVVLYDSDWNPQADLQAQDRAHRIGQRRPVRVFRLVTENTIEEKVVERAQQKLKLDAVVVQQGRLAESTRLGKDDLLSALRFGADAVFRSSEGEVTEEDIDAILARGEARTAELSEKLQKADFGDILDFRLDGSGLGAKNFEGVNYGASGGLPLSFLDVGKRERRPVIKNLFDETKGGGGGGAGKQAPKALRLPAKL
jgi:SWI/SNF-related matrix-associated actin-dependent regulator of chromatin subfamily A member 5